MTSQTLQMLSSLSWFISFTNPKCPKSVKHILHPISHTIYTFSSFVLRFEKLFKLQLKKIRKNNTVGIYFLLHLLTVGVNRQRETKWELYLSLLFLTISLCCLHEAESVAVFICVGECCNRWSHRRHGAKPVANYMWVQVYMSVLV